MRLNRQVLVRGVIGLLVVFLLGLVWAINNLETLVVTFVPGVAIEPTLGPTPPPPTLTVPRGDLPPGHAGLSELAQFPNGAGAIGTSFLLRLPSGVIIGVTTAHSLYLSGWPARGLDSMAFRLPQSEENLVEFHNFYGRPGRVFQGYHFNQDFALLQVTQPVSDALVLTPDPRGAPVPGERVVLASGLGDGHGGPQRYAGTVTAVGPEAVWVQMDTDFAPGGNSGSPLLSLYTGKVVGMAVSAGRRTPVMIGFNPIGVIVAQAAQATEFPPLATYRP